MTTNLAEQKYANKANPGLFGLFTGREQNTEKTDHKTIHETINLLKRAQKTIEKAERVITEQTKRIQSLEDTNTVDALTGFLNYRGFEQAFVRERSRLSRQLDSAGMIVLIEIENFDHVKAKHGKTTSEACLKLVSNILRDEIRDMDSAARLKKNEFALLFAGASTDIALDRTQKLALKVNNLSLVKGTQEIQISASIRLQDFNESTEFSTLF